MDVEYQLDAKRVKRSILEAQLDEEELWDSDEYRRLERQIAQLQAQVGTDSDTTSEIHSK